MESVLKLIFLLFLRQCVIAILARPSLSAMTGRCRHGFGYVTVWCAPSRASASNERFGRGVGPRQTQASAKPAQSPRSSAGHLTLSGLYLTLFGP